MKALIAILLLAAVQATDIEDIDGFRGNLDKKVLAAVDYGLSGLRGLVNGYFY